jgi:hypothetical protein
VGRNEAAAATPEDIAASVAQAHRDAFGREMPARWQRKLRRELGDPAEAALLAGCDAAAWRGCEHWRQQQRSPLHPGIGTLLVYLRHRAATGSLATQDASDPARPLSEIFATQPESIRDRWRAEASRRKPHIPPPSLDAEAARLWWAEGA